MFRVITYCLSSTKLQQNGKFSFRPRPETGQQPITAGDLRTHSLLLVAISPSARALKLLAVPCLFPFASCAQMEANYYM